MRHHLQGTIATAPSISPATLYLLIHFRKSGDIPEFYYHLNNDGNICIVRIDGHMYNESTLRRHILDLVERKMGR